MAQRLGTQRPGASPDPDLPYRDSPPLVPGAAKMVQAMAALLGTRDPGSDAEALRVLRSAYPDLPLTLRLAALAARPARPHIPR
jgi:hypothetical protein